MPRTEPVMPRPQQLEARLALSSGSRAGMVVNLHAGFYLIGRNAECQVRPKSRSVSRRHCLVRHQEGKLHVLDLGSTSGTRLNGERMQPRLWYPLADGDELRCGKIAFAVAAKAVDAPADGAVAAADVPARGDSQAAWQAEDIADWMTDFDELEQAERIQSIRTQTVTEQSERDAESANDTDAAPDHDVAGSSAHGGAAGERTRKRAPAPAKSRSPSTGRWRMPVWSGNWSLAGEGERWKTVLASVLLVAAVVWLLVSLFYLGDDNIYQQVKTLET